MSRDMLSEKVTVAYPHGDRMHPQFVHCLLGLSRHDAQWGHRLDHPVPFVIKQTTNLPAARNELVQTFLESSEADWLWFIDTDQTFPPDILEQMVASADPVERPILSALVMAQTSNRSLPVSPAPVLFDGKDFREAITVPPERYWNVAAAGCGCLLLHRSVLEAVGEKYREDAFRWFKYAQFNRTVDGETVPDIMGEDFTFSLRAAELGFPSVVDTTIEAGHIKERTLSSADFWAQIPPQSRPRGLWAVIPVKDQLALTRALVAQLGDSVNVVLVDNGSGKKMRNWLDSQTAVTVLDGVGMGIHEMWNLGAGYAITNSPTGADIAFLNNDLILSDDALPLLQQTLVEHQELALVAPNYDRREGDPDQRLEYRTDICANKYDGTGGIPGFAFMVRGEFLRQYSFPEECKWWFGDNDILLAIQAAGVMAAIHLDVYVEHIDGGGKTGDWDDPLMQKQLEADKECFIARWS